MRSYTMLLIVIFNSLLFSTTTVAQWYTVQGSARTTGITSELAREMAIENALKKALLVAGASISSVQQVMNGLLTQDGIGTHIYSINSR